jgi:tetratricopeptide (TPR) repeat protein
MRRFTQLLTLLAAGLLVAATPQQRGTSAKSATPDTATQKTAMTNGAKAPEKSTPPAPVTMSDADGQELVLEDFSARTAIQGMLSLTELELRFRNPKAKRVEGRFSCTLPANAAISRFAKEVNGQLMEGEVVERLRANQVYEQFLHQMRDPALLEQDQGNRFSARIFPIEANATTRLVLSYSMVLPMEGGVRRYSLPLRGMPSMKHFTFRAFVTALAGEEGPGAATSDVGGIAGASHSTADVISMDENDYTPARDIELTWHPTETASRLRVLKAGEFYVASYRPENVQTSQSAAPHAWALYVDTSASSAEGSEHRIHALETLLASLPPNDSVQLLAFDQEIVTLGSGTASELSRSAASLLHARLFLGGTDLTALFTDIAKNANPNRAVVVASDLVATLGDTDRHGLAEAMKSIPPRTIVHALILGSRQDTATAKALTAGRGRIVTIPFTDTMDERARAAAEALARPLGASFEAADRGAQWVYPAHADDVQRGDEIITFGRIKAGGEPAPSFGNAAAGTQAFSESLASGAFAPLLEREAYRAYLAYLADREADEPSDAVREALATEQVKISIERRVVIPRTTMLVLESEWDYQRFGLERRALASILTIDAGGIGLMDRRVAGIQQPLTTIVPIVKESRRGLINVPATKAAPVAPAEVKQAAGKDEELPAGVPGGVVGGVEGGVVGGVVGGVLSTNAPPPPADAQSSRVDGVNITDMRQAANQPQSVSESITVTTAEAPMLATNANAVPPPPAVQAPLPSPARPTPAQGAGTAPASSVSETITVPSPRRRQSVSVETRASAQWTKHVVATADEVKALKEKLNADPHDRTLYNQLSGALADREEWSALRALALQWQPYDPENPQVYEILGVADEHLGKTSEAARADASLIEIAPGKTEILQRAGLLLLRTHHANLAEGPLRRALELRPDRVNSYRHLALLLWQDGRIDEAARVLESATRQQFPRWYGDAQRVVREELGYVYRALLEKEPKRRNEIDTRARDYGVDLARKDALRITLAWETDANDVDLHVVDPNGEECYYSHKHNASGLELYEDITQGLGPEVVRTSELLKGTYHVGVNYFSAGPMGVSRGIVVILRNADIDIVPFRLVEDSRQDMRHLAEVVVR